MVDSYVFFMPTISFFDSIGFYYSSGDPPVGADFFKKQKSDCDSHKTGIREYQFSIQTGPTTDRSVVDSDTNAAKLF
jgi:hypothetical protein